MEIHKITEGYVIQRFDENGNFLGQEFIAVGEGSYENEFGHYLDIEEIKEPGYQPFDMAQPN